MGARHRLFSLFLAVVFGLTFMASPAALAKTQKAIIEFDVITKDLEFLDEPDGIIRLMVELPEAAAKYEPQLRDAAGPVFQKTRTQIHEVMNAAQEAIKKNPKQRDKLIGNLNKSYKSYVNDCKKRCSPPSAKNGMTSERGTETGP